MNPLLAADGWVYGAAFLCIVLGAAIQGSTGLGLGMIAAPILAIVYPVLVPGPLLALAFLVSVLLAAREWRTIDRRGLTIALIGRIPASFLAGLTMALLPPSAFGAVFAALVLLAVALSLSGWRVRTTPGAMLAAGAASGYMGTITSIGAPPMAIVYQNAPGPKVRSTMGAFFVLGAAISIVALATFGRFGRAELIASAIFAPAALVGFGLSFWGRAAVDRGRLRPLLLGLSAAAALILLVKSVA